jgi:hypothetical protein
MARTVRPRTALGDTSDLTERRMINRFPLTTDGGRDERDVARSFGRATDELASQPL